MHKMIMMTMMTPMKMVGMIMMMINDYNNDDENEGSGGNDDAAWHSCRASSLSYQHPHHCHVNQRNPLIHKMIIIPPCWPFLPCPALLCLEKNGF